MSASDMQDVTNPDDAKQCYQRTFARPVGPIRASVTGLDESIPFYVIHSPGTCFCTGSAQGRRLMEFVEDRSANLRKRDHIFGCVDIPDDGLTRSIVPAKGLRFGKAGVVTRPKTCFFSLLGCCRSGVEW